VSFLSNDSFKAIITLIIQAMQLEKLIVRFLMRHPVLSTMKFMACNSNANVKMLQPLTAYRN